MIEDKAVQSVSHLTKARDIVVNIPLAELEKDPHPHYRWMREKCPVVYVPETDRVWIMSWELIREAGFNDTVFGPSLWSDSVYGDGQLMSQTGERHRVLRGAANAAVRPKQVKKNYDTLLRVYTKKALEAVRPQGAVDATRDLFEPLSQRVVADFLGFADIEDAVLSRWFRALSDYLVDFGRNPEVTKRSNEVKAEIRAYLEKRLPDFVENPDHTALSHLLHDGMSPGELRSVDEILVNVGPLIVGGFQEPAHLIASTIYALLLHPEQMQQVMHDPGKWARPAIEETLRWLPPFGLTMKLVHEDVTLGGVFIPAGTEVAMIIASANRDPARFERPDEFDINRDGQENVSFGFGSHFCIGHHLARALGEIAVEETVTTLRNLRFDPDQPAQVDGWLVRGAKTLPVLWDV